ncbi:hypothetical protein [Haloarcula onubensis]|uniref:YokE-like PH domain-containing protein n=1 Tax=Haloarcula onubensis TaxID=2950539 RepID=A0ABU2FSC7_9EURY|nr:hypothetical protein [Halomicroarcula sp. S3CR25-11]MDS0283670.1 hypothetical protein [Halomicroarcula sp. S3CR25-11]
MTDRATDDRAQTLAEIAPNETVTAPLLSGAEGRFSTPPLHEPPVAYLEPAESPAYVLSNAKRGVGLGSKRNTVSPSRDHETVMLVTGRRTLCLVGQASTDQVIEIPHEDVAAVGYRTGLRAHRLTVKTPRHIYHCWVTRRADEDLLAAVTEFVEDRQGETPESVGADGTVMYRGLPVQQRSESDEPTPTGEKQTVMYRGLPVDDSE